MSLTGPNFEAIAQKARCRKPRSTGSDSAGSTSSSSAARQIDGWRPAPPRPAQRWQRGSVEVSLSPLKTDDGLRVVAAVSDITERLEVEAETRTVMEMLDATRDGVLILDADTLRFRYVNQGAIEQVGYSRDEFIGMSMLHIAPEFDERKFRGLVGPLERGEATSTTFTTIHRHRDGTDRPVEIVLEARLNDEGRPHSYVKIVRDISERLAAERLLRQAEQDRRMLEDRERIARDLHDIVIQKLFASGMSVQAVTGRITDPESARRLSTVVDDLDQTILEIRSVIFSLHAEPGGGSGLRSEILRIALEESRGHCCIEAARRLPV
jgi:PAS domain S-box-containing protein